MNHVLTIASILCTFLLGSSVYAQSADVVYKNGKIYTVNDSHDWAQAVAISNGKFVHVGSMEEIQAFITPATEIIDLEGRMVTPGINDLHAHPMDAGQKELLQCGFPITHTIDEIVNTLKNCAKNTPRGQWIRGGRWPVEFLQSNIVPHKSLLDQATRDHPVYVLTSHGALFNSKGLEFLGITKNSSAPGSSEIEKDAHGEPTGELQNNAAYDALKLIPAYSDSQNIEALRWSISEMNKVGVTSAKDALVHDYALRAYSALDKSGQLTMRVASSLAWKYSWAAATENEWAEASEKEKDNIAQRAIYQGDRHDPNFAKIVLDGIPPTRTAAMLEPYVPDESHGENFSGILLHSPEQLKLDVSQLDAQGLSVKIHSTGDRSVQVSLDAIEAARESNNNSDLIHEVAHAEFIHPDDIPRFRQLNVAAEMSPVIWYPSPLSIAAGKAVGEMRGKRIFPIKSLLQAGALVIFGSDWPSVSPDPNPWPGIEAMVTRRNPYTNAGEQIWAEQAIELAQAIQIYTRNGAVAMKKENVSGSIEAGKYADFVVLDRNIFAIPITEVSEIRVLLTVFEGKVVFESGIVP
jgi:hypothetical protein